MESKIREQILQEKAHQWLKSLQENTSEENRYRELEVRNTIDNIVVELYLKYN